MGGQEELPEQIVICSTSWQLLKHKASEGLKKDHQWVSVAYTRDDVPFNFYMKVTVLLCIVLAMACANALFYSTETVTTGEAIIIGIISSLIVAPPVAIFVFVFKKAGAYRQQVAAENDAADAPNWLQRESLGSSLRILEKAVRANKNKRAKKERADQENDDL